MKEQLKTALHSILIVVLIIAVSITIAFGIEKVLPIPTLRTRLEETYEAGYIQACKDAYQNKLRYTLVNHPDGTVTWEKVEKNGTTGTTKTTSESR